MTIGTSLFLIAVGAILRYALTADVVEGVNLDTAGLIFMVVGGVGLLLGVFFLARTGTPGPPFVFWAPQPAITASSPRAVSPGRATSTPS